MKHLHADFLSINSHQLQVKCTILNGSLLLDKPWIMMMICSTFPREK